MGIIINSGLKNIIFKEFLVNPIADRRAMHRGVRRTNKNSVVFSLTDVLPKTTITLIRVPLATIVKRQAANAVRNLPPKSPSRGPDGLMFRQTPNKRNLKK